MKGKINCGQIERAKDASVHVIIVKEKKKNIYKVGETLFSLTVDDPVCGSEEPPSKRENGEWCTFVLGGLLASGNLDVGDTVVVDGLAK